MESGQMEAGLSKPPVMASTLVGTLFLYEWERFLTGFSWSRSQRRRMQRFEDWSFVRRINMDMDMDLRRLSRGVEG